MFWKVFESTVRLVHRKRFKHAERISEAATLAGEGKLEEALQMLEELEPNLHKSMQSLYYLTLGRILDAAGRTREAESAVIMAAKADPSNAKAHLDLAVMSGRRFRLKDAQARLEKLAIDADDETKEKAQEILGLVDEILSGKKAAELDRRARKMAQRPLGPKGEKSRPASGPEAFG